MSFNFKSVLLLCALAVPMFARAEPQAIPADKRAYIGEWKGKDMELNIAAASKQPIELSFASDGAEHAASIDYFGSLRYPVLERIPGAADRLTRLLGKVE